MYGPQQEQQPSPPLPQPQRDPAPLPQQQNTSSKITISQMQEQLLLSKHMRFTSLVSCMGYSMPEMAPAYLVRVCPAEKIEKGTDHMSDYQNSDTAKWDAQEVRKQTSSGEGPKKKKKRRLGWLGYLAGVIVASFLLAGIGWLAVNDVCALNKAPLTATIEVESGDSVGTVANNLKKQGGFIPGFRPGKPTVDFIRKVLNKITLFGAIYLGVVAILPLLIGKIVNVAALSIGGTSVIIVVGVALETVKSLEAQMLMRHYKGFLE